MTKSAFRSSIDIFSRIYMCLSVYFYLTRPPTKQKTILKFGTDTPLDHLLFFFRKNDHKGRYLRKTSMSRRFPHISMTALFFIIFIYFLITY